VLPNIFAPFEAEHELGLEYGTLWNEWVEDMRKELAELKETYGSAADLTPEQKIAAGNGNQEPGEEE
jgi:hypothetical protein